VRPVNSKGCGPSVRSGLPNRSPDSAPRWAAADSSAPRIANAMTSVPVAGSRLNLSAIRQRRADEYSDSGHFAAFLKGYQSVEREVRIIGVPINERSDHLKPRSAHHVQRPSNRDPHPDAKWQRQKRLYERQAQ